MAKQKDRDTRSGGVMEAEAYARYVEHSVTHHDKVNRTFSLAINQVHTSVSSNSGPHNRAAPLS
jgi:hypothetical protein